MQALQEKFVFVKVNGYEDTLKATNWHIKYYPSLLLMTTEGDEIDRLVGFFPPDSFVQVVEDYLAGRNTFEDLLARSQAHPDSVDLLTRIAEKYDFTQQEEKAESCYRVFLDRDVDNRSGHADQVLHSLALMAYVEGAEGYDSALARFGLLIERYPASEYAEDARTYVPYIYAKQGKGAEARLLYEQFLVDYPESGEAGWVRRQIEALKQEGP